MGGRRGKSSSNFTQDPARVRLPKEESTNSMRVLRNIDRINRWLEEMWEGAGGKSRRLSLS